jgi:hypothetical protein
VNAVKGVFPNASITVNCLDEYPVKVSIMFNNGAQALKIWEGSQKKLFRKYASDRTKAIQEITESLEELAEDFS